MFLQLARHTPLNSHENIQALYHLFENTKELQEDLFTKIRATLQDMIIINTTPQPKITQENYEQYIQLWRETSDRVYSEILYNTLQDFRYSSKLEHDYHKCSTQDNQQNAEVNSRIANYT